MDDDTFHTTLTTLSGIFRGLVSPTAGLPGVGSYISSALINVASIIDGKNADGLTQLENLRKALANEDVTKGVAAYVDSVAASVADEPPLSRSGSVESVAGVSGAQS
jgi:hypothetical protein